jgi:membrane-associated protein
MKYITHFINIILHIDTYLISIIQSFGNWTYLILFITIFCETGLVIIPFLPGDSLVFAAGAFAARGDMNLVILLIILCIAAVVGDTVNYEIGKYIGPKILKQDKIKFIKKEHLERTHKFYEKYGGKTIIFARFIPIVRTFAPFVAGIGEMSYKKFISYNIIGGISWICLFLFGGYIFGDIPMVKNNFTSVIYAIIVISALPALFEFLRQKYFVKESK